ncbi:MAG: hypothetical protein KAI24_02515 [Planctomycetes bacterium]|nr:hypothetical protein [Planctomycetota bacterium]
MLTNTRAPRFLLPLILLAAAAPAQDDYDERRAEVDQKVVRKLVAFGRRATGLKQAEDARVAFQMVLDHYDIDQPTARKGLGFRKVGDEWVEGKARLGDTVEDAKKAARVRREWEKTCKAVGKIHGAFGMELLADGEISRANYQLERALEFSPDVEEWHRALGHEEVDGFFGTGEQVAFVRRFREIREKARELATAAYEVRDLPQSEVPKELRPSGFAFYGARSKHFTHWVIDSQEQARESVQWAERARALSHFVAGDAISKATPRNEKYLVILRTHEQFETLLAQSPVTRGKYTFEQAKLFGGSNYKVGKGWAYIENQPLEDSADRVVGHTVRRHFVGRHNDGFGEGCVHAMTWLMVGTLKSHFTKLQHTVTKGMKPLQRRPDDWRERLHAEVAAGNDWPMAQIPRERIDNFRDSVRVKSWSVVLFLMARFPDRWYAFLASLPDVKGLTVEQVEKCFEDELGCTVGKVDAEWREWAREGSRIGRATDG